VCGVFSAPIVATVAKRAIGGMLIYRINRRIDSKAKIIIIEVS
jgi:hypothetical protein